MNNILSNRLANGKVRSKPRKLVPIVKHEDTDVPGASSWKDFQLKEIIPMEECLSLCCLKFVKPKSSQNDVLFLSQTL